eukprot:TRINITY_DN110_c0_g1_i5.p1 TRINITY_DN110_c0_g1~~TRINITY_DN110_c0_g1_i5.p1  ORF type:complete len:271 (-),score=70.04 TRINITY_DN110_c0_g1_i5:18-830(-)
MGISRDSVHKRRATGGRQKRIRMKRKFELGRQPASTKIGDKKINRVRVRGGHYKFRALRLDHGNFSWAGEAVTRKTRILKVVYNATNNELVRTNTLVKGSIVQIDSTPFKAWYLQFYNVDLGKKKDEKEDKTKKEDKEEKKDEQTEKDQSKKSKKEDKKDKSKKDDKETKGKGKEKSETKGKGKKDKKSDDKDKKETTEPVKKSRSLKAKIAKRNKTRVLEQPLADQFKTGRIYAKLTSRPGQSGRADGYILEGEELAFYSKKMLMKKKK